MCNLSMPVWLARRLKRCKSLGSKLRNHKSRPKKVTHLVYNDHSFFQVLSRAEPGVFKLLPFGSGSWFRTDWVSRFVQATNFPRWKASRRPEPWICATWATLSPALPHGRWSAHAATHAWRGARTSLTQLVGPGTRGSTDGGAQLWAFGRIHNDSMIHYMHNSIILLWSKWLRELLGGLYM